MIGISVFADNENITFGKINVYIDYSYDVPAPTDVVFYLTLYTANGITICADIASDTIPVSGGGTGTVIYENIDIPENPNILNQDLYAMVSVVDKNTGEVYIDKYTEKVAHIVSPPLPVEISNLTYDISTDALGRDDILRVDFTFDYTADEDIKVIPYLKLECLNREGKIEGSGSIIHLETGSGSYSGSIFVANDGSLGECSDDFGNKADITLYFVHYNTGAVITSITCPECIVISLIKSTLTSDSPEYDFGETAKMTLTLISSALDGVDFRVILWTSSAEYPHAKLFQTDWLYSRLYQDITDTTNIACHIPSDCWYFGSVDAEIIVKRHGTGTKLVDKLIPELFSIIPSATFTITDIYVEEVG